MEEYIKTFPEATQKILIEVRDAIRSVVPEGTEETMSYGMPTFKLNGNLVHFAAWNNHLGFYPTPSGIKNFVQELAPYEGSKGAIKFPYHSPMPLELIKEITLFRVQENLAKKKRWKNSYSASLQPLSAYVLRRMKKKSIHSFLK